MKRLVTEEERYPFFELIPADDEKDVVSIARWIELSDAEIQIIQRVTAEFEFMQGLLRDRYLDSKDEL